MGLGSTTTKQMKHRTVVVVALLLRLWLHFYTEKMSSLTLILTHLSVSLVPFLRLLIFVAAGVLLYGPPGTGKTLLARACAKHTDAVFLKLAGPQLVQMFIGDGAKLVRDAFELAKEKIKSGDRKGGKHRTLSFSFFREYGPAIQEYVYIRLLLSALASHPHVPLFSLLFTPIA